MACKHLIISGKVQGVFYRASARRKAEEYGISGWIRNTPEGDVEIIAQGDAGQLRRFVEWCRKGPSNARVDGVSIEDVPEQDVKEFTIRR